jgi:hypothetical protein
MRSRLGVVHVLVGWWWWCSQLWRAVGIQRCTRDAVYKGIPAVASSCPLVKADIDFFVEDLVALCNLVLAIAESLGMCSCNAHTLS